MYPRERSFSAACWLVLLSRYLHSLGATHHISNCHSATVVKMDGPPLLLLVQPHTVELCAVSLLTILFVIRLDGFPLLLHMWMRIWNSAISVTRVVTVDNCDPSSVVQFCVKETSLLPGWANLDSNLVNWCSHYVSSGEEKKDFSQLKKMWNTLNENFTKKKKKQFPTLNGKMHAFNIRNLINKNSLRFIFFVQIDWLSGKK